MAYFLQPTSASVTSGDGNNSASWSSRTMFDLDKLRSCQAKDKTFNNDQRIETNYQSAFQRAEQLKTRLQPDQLSKYHAGIQKKGYFEVELLRKCLSSIHVTRSSCLTLPRRKKRLSSTVQPSVRIFIHALGLVEPDRRWVQLEIKGFNISPFLLLLKTLHHHYKTILEPSQKKLNPEQDTWVSQHPTHFMISYIFCRMTHTI